MVERVGEGVDTGRASVYLSCSCVCLGAREFCCCIGCKTSDQTTIRAFLDVALPPAKHKEAPEAKAKRVIQMWRPLSLSAGCLSTFIYITHGRYPFASDNSRKSRQTQQSLGKRQLASLSQPLGAPERMHSVKIAFLK